MVTGSELVVQLQKSDADPVKYQYEERLTNPCLMSAELAVVRTDVIQVRKSAQLYCFEAQSSCPMPLRSLARLGIFCYCLTIAAFGFSSSGIFQMEI